MKLLEEKIQENFLWPRDKQRFLRIQKARYIKRKRVIIRGISSKYKRCFKQNEKPQIGKEICDTYLIENLNPEFTEHSQNPIIRKQTTQF